MKPCSCSRCHSWNVTTYSDDKTDCCVPVTCTVRIGRRLDHCNSVRLLASGPCPGRRSCIMGLVILKVWKSNDGMKCLLGRDGISASNTCCRARCKQIICTHSSTYNIQTSAKIFYLTVKGTKIC